MITPRTTWQSPTVANGTVLGCILFLMSVGHALAVEPAGVKPPSVSPDQFQTYEQIMEKVGATRPFNTDKGLNDELIKEVNANLTRDVKLHQLKKQVKVERINEQPDFFRVKVPEAGFVSGPNQYVVRQWLYFPKSEWPNVPALSPGQEIVATGPMFRCDLMREKDRLILIVDIRPTTFTIAPPQNGFIPRSEPPPSTPAPPDNGSKGIMLEKGWDNPVQGGSRTMEDLGYAFAGAAEPNANLSPDSSIIIYPGISYLMPANATWSALHLQNKPLSKNPIACPGLPRGSLWYYAVDGQFEGHYNRMYVVVDRGDQVVSMQLVDEAPKTGPAFVPDRTEFSTYNFINTRTKGKPDLRIEYHLSTLSGTGWVAFRAGATGGKQSPQFGKAFRLDSTLISTDVPRSRTNHFGSGLRPLEDVRWYVPKPMIELILYCIEKSSHK
jgi:hypothetical protein